MTISESLADYWSSAKYDDMPPETVRHAKLCLLDTLGAGIAGSKSDVAAIALETAQHALESPRGSSIVWGTKTTLPAPAAALVNGTAAHALELDDLGGCGHSGAVVIPAVCALASRERLTGKDALIAIIAGYDVAARILEGAGGYRPHNDLGGPTGTCGSFGAAAGAAKALKLERKQFAHALGIAGTFTGGVWAFLDDGAMTKRFYPGKASENGLSAALLARSGMTGPRKVLEADAGFFATYSRGTATPQATLAGLGTEFRGAPQNSLSDEDLEHKARSQIEPVLGKDGCNAILDCIFRLDAVTDLNELLNRLKP